MLAVPEMVITETPASTESVLGLTWMSPLPSEVVGCSCTQTGLDSSHVMLEPGMENVVDE